MIYLAAFVSALSFLAPLNLYPDVDFVKNFLGVLGGLFLFVSVMYQRATNLAVSRSTGLLFVILAGLVLLDGLGHYHAFVYLVSLSMALLVSVAISSLAERYSESRVAGVLAWFMVVVAGLSVLLGILRYYGLMTLLLPWVADGGPRMIGALGQPNLTALVVLMGLISFIYLFATGQIRSRLWLLYPFWLCIGAVLTGSRFFYLGIATLCLISVIEFIRNYFSASCRWQTLWSKGVLLTLLSLVLAYAVVPVADEFLTNTSVQAGLIDRESFSEISDARLRFGDVQRVGEWKKVIGGVSELDSIWLGNGPGSYPLFSTTMEVSGYSVNNQLLWTHPHNLLLMLLVEYGLLGLLVFLSFCFYLLFIYWTRPRTPVFVFAASIVAIILLQNQVEFSFWFSPFLLVFVAFLSLFDSKYKISWSQRPVLIGITSIVLIVALLVSVYAVRDYVHVVRIFQTIDIDDPDQYRLQDISRSSILGKGAMSVRILRLDPPSGGYERQLMEADHFVETWPSQLFLHRRAALTAVVHGGDVACDRIRTAVRLYPDGVNILSRDLKSINEHVPLDMSYFEACILEGMEFWLDRK